MRCPKGDLWYVVFIITLIITTHGWTVKHINMFIEKRKTYGHHQKQYRLRSLRACSSVRHNLYTSYRHRVESLSCARPPPKSHHAYGHSMHAVTC